MSVHERARVHEVSIHERVVIEWVIKPMMEMIEMMEMIYEEKRTADKNRWRDPNRRGRIIGLRIWHRIHDGRPGRRQVGQ
jgi:hypothetical protein